MLHKRPIITISQRSWRYAVALILSISLGMSAHAAPSDDEGKATIVVAPVFVSDPAEQLSEAFFTSYMDLVRAHLSSELSRLSDREVEVHYVENFELANWSHVVEERVFAGFVSSGKTTRKKFKSLPFNVHWAVSQFEVSLEGVRHSDLVDVVIAASQKVRNGSFGVVERTAYADQVLEALDRNKMGSLPVALAKTDNKHIDN